jgi:aspartyl-tRNA(Asn)/glutamyl-tRNA(Gln) amidotransferase subunit C
MKKEDIEHLATLARIELSGTEVTELADDITSILGYVSKINEITAEHNKEKSVGPLHNVMREDTDAHEPNKHTEELLSAAPDRDGRYIRVKKILDGQ